MYDIHIYRSRSSEASGLGPGAPHDYDTIKQRLVAKKVNISTVPVIIGECGVNGWTTNQTDYQNELAYFENLLKILNEWGIGYLGWRWWPCIPEGQQQDCQFGLLKNELAIPRPNDAGLILLNAMRGIAEAGVMATSLETRTSTQTSGVTAVSATAITTLYETSRLESQRQTFRKLFSSVIH